MISYFVGRNRAGIRVFINRGARSISTAPPAEKILPRAGNSSGDARTSSVESGFKEICSEEVLDSDDPGAPSPARGVLGQTEVKLDGTGPAPGRPKPTAGGDSGVELGGVLGACW